MTWIYYYMVLIPYQFFRDYMFRLLYTILVIDMSIYHRIYKRKMFWAVFLGHTVSSTVRGDTVLNTVCWHTVLSKVWGHTGLIQYDFILCFIIHYEVILYWVQYDIILYSMQYNIILYYYSIRSYCIEYIMTLII